MKRTCSLNINKDKNLLCVFPVCWQAYDNLIQKYCRYNYKSLKIVDFSFLSYDLYKNLLTKT